MANRTKAELINEIEHLRTENYERSDRLREKSKEIKALQAAVKANEQWRRENNSEIKLLRDQATCDAFEIRELRNEIRDLQDVVIALRNDCNNLTAEKHEKANKVKELEQVLKTAVDMRDFWLEEKDSEISKLDKAVAQLGGVIGEKDKKIKDLEADKWRLYDLEDEYRKEIKNLRDAVAELGGVISEKDSEIKRLHQHIDDDEITIQNKENEINNLHCEVKRLKDKIADLEQKRKDSRRFHYATEALGNPLHFQGVIND